MEHLYIKVFENEIGVKAFFSTKAGSSIKSPYYNKAVLEDLSLQDCTLIWPKQVHEANVEVIKEIPRLFNKNEQEKMGVTISATDGIVTNLPHVLLTTVHADCLAIFFYDMKKKAIGLVHAGWRGTVRGIACNAVKTMVKEYGSNPEDMIVFISPGISKCCFEVGIEVYNTFKENWNWIDDYSEKKGEKFYLDLKAINHRQLLDIGIKNIQVSHYCTCCEQNMFCSYRGEGGTTRRMGAGICLLEE